MGHTILKMHQGLRIFPRKIIIYILKLKLCQKYYLEKSGLKTCESTADSQIQFLPSIHTFGLILIWLAKIIHGGFDVFFSDGRKMSPKHRLERPQIYYNIVEQKFIKNIRDQQSSCFL